MPSHTPKERAKRFGNPKKKKKRRMAELIKRAK